MTGDQDNRRSPVRPRPQWVKAIHSFVHDGIIEDQYGYPMNGTDDDVLTEIEAAVDEVLCRLYGHEIIDDQCGKPGGGHREATDVSDPWMYNLANAVEHLMDYLIGELKSEVHTLTAKLAEAQTARDNLMDGDQRRLFAALTAERDALRRKLDALSSLWSRPDNSPSPVEGGQ
jgi:hypothetical protein